MTKLMIDVYKRQVYIYLILIWSFVQYFECSKKNVSTLLNYRRKDVYKRQVNIWDTNTHTIYKSEKRSEITRKYFPYFGYEIEKPLTSPIVVGDNCWIGERSSIMKGTQIGDNVIVGYNTMLLNKIIESNKDVYKRQISLPTKRNSAVW